MKKRMFISTLTLLSTAVPLIVLAADLTPAQLLEEDLKFWEEIQKDNESEAIRQQRDIEFQSAAELFPEINADEAGSQLDRVRDERIADFVSVMVDGSLVVFSDVPRFTWFAPYVREIADRGIVSGYRDAAGVPTGLFGPQDNVTLEQMAKVMLFASGVDQSTCPAAPMNLSSSGSWSARFVSCAEQLQWDAYTDSAQSMQRNATRSEVIITLIQAFNETTDQQTGSGGFTDVTLSTPYAPAINKAKTDGIISGYTDANGSSTGMFGPQDPVTRAEFSKIVTLGLQIYGNEPVEQSAE